MTKPQIIDFLKFNAKTKPDHIAIQSIHGSFTFKELLDRVQRIAHKLRMHGIQPRQTTIISIPDNYINWIITLALTHEAAITASNNGNIPINSNIDVDWIITDEIQDHHPKNQTILIDNTWLSDIKNYTTEIAHINYPEGGSLARLVMTSGTTGESKAVPWSHDYIIDRTLYRIMRIGNRTSLCLLSLATTSGYSTALQALITGNTYYCTQSTEEAIELIKKFNITSIFASPAQINGIIDYLKSKNNDTPDITEVISVGSAIPSKLHENINKFLHTDPISFYGSTEAGLICVKSTKTDNNPFSAGHILPEARIEIVNNLHQPIKDGEPGIIRIKTPFSTQEYYKHPEATKQSFHDGWWYPGDTGYITPDNQLILTGRTSELINCGGLKIDPVTLDLFLAMAPGIEDAAVFGYENAQGTQDIAAAIVYKSTLNPKDLSDAVMVEFGISRTPTLWFRVDQIPRNAMGKIKRAELAEQLSSQVHAAIQAQT